MLYLSSLCPLVVPQTEVAEEASTMSLQDKVSWSVRVPGSVTVTEIMLGVKRLKSSGSFPKPVVSRIVVLDLDPARRDKLRDGTCAYPVCQMLVYLDKIQQLQADSIVMMKVTLSNNTTIKPKNALDARPLIQCLKNHSRFDKIHINLHVSSFQPLKCELKVKIKAAAINKRDKSVAEPNQNKKRLMSESSPHSTKRRKTQTQSPNERAAAVTKKRDITAYGTAGEPSMTMSHRNKKRSSSASPPRSLKRRKIHAKSPNEQVAAVIKKRDITTHGAADETKVTMSHRNKKRSSSASSPRSLKRCKIHAHPPNEQLADVNNKRNTTTHRAADEAGETCMTKRKRKKESSLSSSTKKQKTQTYAGTPLPCAQMPSKPSTLKPLSKKERKLMRLLHQQGIRLFKTDDVKAIKTLGTKLLGSGSYGSCHLALHPNTRQPLVIKTFPRHSLDDLATEARNMHELRLPGVQRLVGVCVPTRQLITGFAGTTLNKYFRQTKPSFADAISVFLQISTTLQQMHDKGFSHNDIKDDNICVQVDSNGPKATIIDLGLAERDGATQIYQYTSDTDSYPWIAPELLLHTHPCGEASDVYSMAHLLKDYCLKIRNMRGMQLLAPLISWVRSARNPEPRKRPCLAALTDLLQRMQHESLYDMKE